MAQSQNSANAHRAPSELAVVSLGNLERNTTMKTKWLFQEIRFEWSVLAFGARYIDRRGWDTDELTIYIGPMRIEFISESQILVD